jgi:hypothetical protein
MVNFDITTILIFLVVFGIIAFALMKLGVFKKVQFKGREEVQQIVFTDSAEKIKMLGITPKRKTMLYRDVMPIGRIYKMMLIPYSVVTKEKTDDQVTGEIKYKKIVITGEMFMFETRQGFWSFLGFGKTIFFINEKFVEHLSDGYKISRDIDLERWGQSFWYSKDVITAIQTENIVWKSNYTDILGLVKEFPEKLIMYDASTAKAVKEIQEDYRGQKELRQGRIIKGD